MVAKGGGGGKVRMGDKRKRPGTRFDLHNHGILEPQNSDQVEFLLFPFVWKSLLHTPL